MIDLAIARAPHQVLYSMERLAGEPGCKRVLVLDLFRHQNFGNTLTRILEKTRWDHVIKLNYGAKTALGISRYVGYLLLLKVLSYGRLKIRHLVIGDGGVLFAKLIIDNFKHVENVVLVGDGMDYMASHQRQSDPEIRYWCRIGSRARRMLRILRLDFQEEYRFDELYSFYDVSDRRLNVNRFAWTRALSVQKPSVPDSVGVYFLGTPLLHLSDPATVRDLYRRILSHYPNSRIGYIPHRRESRTQQEIVAECGDVTLIQSDGDIAELLFVSRGITPTHLAGFVGNGLYALSRIYPTARVDFYGYHTLVAEDELLRQQIRCFYEVIADQVQREGDRCTVFSL